MANAVKLISWLGNFDVEILGDAGDLFTKWLWNWDKVPAMIEPLKLN